jgi:hypothetical protein
LLRRLAGVEMTRRVVQLQPLRRFFLDQQVLGAPAATVTLGFQRSFMRRC